MPATTRRRCRACYVPLDPDAAAAAVTCLPCWRRVPTRLRLAAARAYKARRRDPDAHMQAQAGILQWCNDQATRLGALVDDNDG